MRVTLWNITADDEFRSAVIQQPGDVVEHAEPDDGMVRFGVFGASGVAEIKAIHKQFDELRARNERRV